MAEGGDNDGGNTNGGNTNGGNNNGANSSSSSAVGSDNGNSNNDNGGGGGNADPGTTTTSDSDASKAAPSAETSTTTTDTDPSKSVDTGYSFSGAINTSLADTLSSLSLSNDTAKAAAMSASFGAMPDSFGSLAADTAVGHFGMSALQGTMAGLATHSGKVGLSVGINAATNPTSIASALSTVATKGLGMNTTSHNVGGMIGSHLGSAIGPVGAVVGGFLGTVAAELSLDALDARDNEMARDAMEDGLGPISGRAQAAAMSDLGFAGFTEGLNDPSMSGLGGYTAGAIGQAEATAEAAMSLGDPTAGIGVSATSISGMDTSTNPGMGISSAIGSAIANANNALATAAMAPDRSGALGSTGITASSIAAQEASMDALGDNISFTPTRSYGWLRAGLPVSAPSSPYRSSYWDGTRFVNMNDYRGFM